MNLKFKGGVQGSGFVAHGLGFLGLGLGSTYSLQGNSFGLLPSRDILLNTWYTKTELNRRLIYIYIDR